jgi:hypothetical protein
LRPYPHQPAADELKESFSDDKEGLVPDKDMTPELIAARTEMFFRINATTALDCAAFAYALEHPQSDVKGYLRESRLCFARALKFNAPIPLNDYHVQLSVAQILNDREFSQTLSALPRQRYTHPDVGFDEIMFLLAEFDASLAQGNLQAVEERIRSARALLANSPKSLRDSIATFLDLQQAVAARDQSALDKGFRAHEAAFGQAFRPPMMRNMPRGLLDFWGLGLARLAANAGLTVHEQSVYLPLELLD